jgi:hypothetical protein
MVYRTLADLVVLVHFAFVLFVVAGALLVLRWRWVAWIHVPAAVWGALIEFAGWICPLTPLEQRLRMMGGSAGYTGGFIEHYILPILYPAGLNRRVQIVLGVLVLAVNVGIYAWVVLRVLRARANNAS